MPEYPMPPYGVLPFHDPIARVIPHKGGDIILKTIAWRDQARFNRMMRRAGHGWGDVEPLPHEFDDDDRF